MKVLARVVRVVGGPSPFMRGLGPLAASTFGTDAEEGL